MLVNNAGLQLGKWNDGMAALSHDDWRRVLDVNVLGAVVCSSAVPGRAVACRTGAAVYEPSSIAAGRSAFGACGVSKLALDGVTHTLHAADLAADGIRVNGITPGVMVTPELEDRSTELPRRRGRPGGRCTAQDAEAGRPGRPGPAPVLGRRVVHHRSALRIDRRLHAG